MHAGASAAILKEEIIPGHTGVKIFFEKSVRTAQEPASYRTEGHGQQKQGGLSVREAASCPEPFGR